MTSSTMSQHLVTLACVHACLLLPVAVRAQMMPQEGNTVVSPVLQVPAQKTLVLPAERLGPDDLVELTVANCPELTRTFRLSSDGTLPLPLLSAPLQAAGLTPVELGRQVRTALMQQNLLVDPVVNVAVVEYRSRPVSVIGAVTKPVTFQATGNTTLMSALAAAGGLTPTAGSTILVASTSDKGEPVVRTFATRDVLAGAVNANPMLHGGEEIRIPEGGKIFVAGNVIRPGMYPMQNDAETTVVKAVTLSAGLAPFSDKVAYIYRHGSADGQKIELSRILAHKAPDVAMHADDILYVPTNDGKKLAMRVITQAAGFGQSVGSYAVVR